jgi:hypothetical protein
VARVQFAIVAENTIQSLQAEIPALPLAFQLIEKAYRLDIVLKGGQAVFGAECGQEMFAIVTERGVADVMAKGDGLNEVFVEMEKAADGSGNAGDQLHVQDAVGDVVVGDQAEDLGLVDVAGVGPGVEDAVSIQSIGLPIAFMRLVLSSFGMNAQSSGRRKTSLLILIEAVQEGKQECVWV